MIRSGLSSIGETLNTALGDVKSFLVDRSGLIWLGTNAQGIHLIDLETPFFQSFTYNKDFATDMLQQEMGINLRQLVGWTAADQQFSQPSYYIRSVYDKNKRFYFALKETVCYWNAGHHPINHSSACTHSGGHRKTPYWNQGYYPATQWLAVGDRLQWRYDVFRFNRKQMDFFYRTRFSEEKIWFADASFIYAGG